LASCFFRHAGTAAPDRPEDLPEDRFNVFRAPGTYLQNK
jgi:hypothetical protein